MSNKTCDVVYHWSPTEAAAIVDYLDHLRDLVWEHYSQDIIDLRTSEDGTQTESSERAAKPCKSQHTFAFEISQER